MQTVCSFVSYTYKDLPTFQSGLVSALIENFS